MAGLEALGTTFSVVCSHLRPDQVEPYLAGYIDFQDWTSAGNVLDLSRNMSRQSLREEAHNQDGARELVARHHEPCGVR